MSDTTGGTPGEPGRDHDPSPAAAGADHDRSSHLSGTDRDPSRAPSGADEASGDPARATGATGGPAPARPARPPARGGDDVARALSAVALLVAVVALFVAFTGTDDGSAPSPAAGTDAAAAAAGTGIANPTLGDEAAPVTMVVYSDYLCPYCTRFERETAPELIRDYVDEGLLRIEWRDFPAKGEQAVQAAVAARAAQEQGAFWEYHDRLFAEDAPPDRDTLLAHARALELDLARFEQALDNPLLRETVLADYRTGQQEGVRGTPTFFFNGQQLVGAQPTETFHQVIGYLLDEGATSSG